MAQLAGIIQEFLPQSNMFSLYFKVRPEVQMAIRRNKLRISSILHHGWVLSFCAQSIPKEMFNSGYEDDSTEYAGSPYGHDGSLYISRQNSLNIHHNTYGNIISPSGNHGFGMGDSMNSIHGFHSPEWDNIVDSSANTPRWGATSPSPKVGALPAESFSFTDDEQDDNNTNHEITMVPTPIALVCHSWMTRSK